MGILFPTYPHMYLSKNVAALTATIKNGDYTAVL